MSYKTMAAHVTLALAVTFTGSTGLSAQHSHPAPVLGPTPASAALLPGRTQPGVSAVANGTAAPVARRSEVADNVLTEAMVLVGASLGGVWAGRQVPFDPADDDSDLSVWHFVTVPVASTAAVAVTSALLGNGTSSSVTASLMGAGAGLVTAVAASTVTADGTALISYAVVHGVVAALKAR